MTAGDFPVRQTEQLKKQCLIVIALDGLSTSTAAKLLERLDGARKWLEDYKLKPLIHPPVSTFQPIWGELLWGIPWFELGLPGYASPQSSLNRTELVSEDHFSQPCRLLPDSGKHLAVNVPLLKPKQNRHWLSDGSLPNAQSVSPSEFAFKPPFDAYKPRALSSIAQGAANLSEAIASCTSVERLRLDCAAKLMQENEWQTCIVRLSFLDQLFHLLGESWLEEIDRTAGAAITEFLVALDSWLTNARRQFPNALIVPLSAAGHTGCRARVNLNGLLWRGGFCSPARRGTSSQQSRYHRSAAALSLLRETREVEQLAVTPSWEFESASTLCGSPVQGAIYLNLRERYEDGVVELSEAMALIDRAKNYLTATIKQELGINPTWWQCENIGATGPELMIHVEGVEFYNSALGDAIDVTNKPRSTHTCEGFVWLPDGGDLPARSMTPLDLHEHLYREIYG